MVGNHLPQPWEVETKNDQEEQVVVKADFKKFDEPVISSETYVNNAYVVTE